MSFAENKVALVTGGASGIGLAIVKKLLDSNVKAIGIIDFSEVNWNSVKSSLNQQYGNKIYFVKADVSNNEELKNAFEKIVEKFKNLDIVVNNAGVLDEDNWQKMVSVNLMGVIQGTYLALDYLPKYRSTEETLIINTASILGLDTIPSLPAYCAAKHGVVGFAKSLSAQEIFEKSNIRLITICPGWIETNIFHKQDEASQEKVAKELYAILCEKVVPANYIGESVLKVMDIAKHGTVWVLEDGKTPYEVAFRARKEMKKAT